MTTVLSGLRKGGLIARRARTPTVLQTEAIECGAAALAIILGYFGRHVALDELREACGVSRDGSNAKDLLRAARQYGLTTKAYRRTTDTVLQGPFPAILFWNFDHFLVIEGARDNRVFLNDPARGHVTISRETFSKSYSGVVLTFERSETFVPGGAAGGLLSRVMEHARILRGQKWLLLGLGALIAVPGFVAPASTVVFVDQFVVRDSSGWLAPFLLFLALVVCLQAVLASVRESSLVQLTAQISSRRSADLMWRVLRLPVTYFHFHYLGEVIGRIASVERVTQMVVRGVGGTAINLVTVCVLLLLMTLLSPVLAVISFGGALLNLFVTRYVRDAYREASTRMQAERDKLFAISVIGLRTIETMKASGGEDDFFQRWAGCYAKTINAEKRLLRLDQYTALLPPTLAVATMTVALWFGGGRVLDSLLTIGALLAYQALFASIASPVQQMVSAAGAGERLTGDLARIDDIFDHRLDWRHEPKATEQSGLGEVAVALELDNVCFGYDPKSSPLFNRFSLSVAPGSQIAIVGPPGCGKSTLARLITGLHQPSSGAVRLNGVSITTLDRRTLARMVALVSQEVTLFGGTIRDNVCLWDETIPYGDLLAAVQDADLFESVAARPGTFDAAVEEAGRNFSSGERQRIGIARGLVRAPGLLVLDEATDSLESATELNITAALRRRGATCIIFTHRLGAIRSCDEIVVLDGGRIVGRGQHDELLRSSAIYARLFDTDQMS